MRCERILKKLFLPNVRVVRTIRMRTGFSFCGDFNFLTKEEKMRDKISNILALFSQSLERNKDLFYDAEEIWELISQRGYSDDDIESAISHIQKTSLEIPGPFWSEDVPVYRSYADEEHSRLSKTAKGYLWKLKMRGIIDHAIEDEIIQKVMNLESPAGLREIKTVAALTVFGYEHKIQGGTSSSSTLVESRVN
jgi:uncharacterized protein Smg (DUF494 family)